MRKKISDAGSHRSSSSSAWNLLRVALLWARKGGVFKRKFIMELRLLPRYLKTLRHSSQRGAIHYGERELSFDDTPIFHVKMHRPASLRFRFPCINPPQVDFDYDFGFNDDIMTTTTYYNDGEKKTSLNYGGDEDEEEEEEDHDHYGCEDQMVPCEDEGIDLKAEEFIAKFYHQMKLQRQISYLQYNTQDA